MKRIQVELPEKLAEQVDALVREGWFNSEQDLVRTAVPEFLRHRRLELAEELQREDIAWAMQQKSTPQCGRSFPTRVRSFTFSRPPGYHVS